MRDRVVIVGAGHAGGRVAQELSRMGGFDITLIGAEEHPPYERPKLSKSILRGQATLADCLVWQPEDPAWSGTALVAGEQVTRIDRRKRVVQCASGAVFPYDYLVLATGASVRQVNLSDHNVHFLRAIEDSLRLSALLTQTKRLLVVGGGFMGLEIAATACSLGVAVTVVECSDRLLGRVVPNEIAHRLLAEHRKNGVDVVFGAMIDEVLSTPTGDMVGVRLTTGELVSCDMIVVATGVAPNTRVAADAGLSIRAGIRVDSSMRTSDERIFACGDVASPFLERYGVHFRLESWHAAQTQAVTIANNIADIRSTYSDVPFYWSDQFDLSVQVFGIPSMGVRTVSKPLENEQLMLVHLDSMRRIVAVTGIGNPSNIGRRLRKLRSMIMATAPVDLRDLAAERIFA